MRGIVMWMAAGAMLLFGPGVAIPLKAQCMGCVNSSACGESSKRGSCTAECLGTICACSDNTCRPTITALPAGAESPPHFAAHDAVGQERPDTHGLLVQYCDGEMELLVYSADGTRLLDSRLVAPLPAPRLPIRVAQDAEAGRDKE